MRRFDLFALLPEPLRPSGSATLEAFASALWSG